MTRRLTCVLLLLLAAACARLPVTDELKIEPDGDGDTVVVTASTTFYLDRPTEALQARVEAARAAALANTDPWAVRFARLDTPEEEWVTYQKSAGSLQRVVRSARIPGDDLQQLLSDTNLTVDVLRGDGWRELAFYPGSGGRATREQQKELDAALSTWSESVARYFIAVDHLYDYLRTAPGRDQYVFAALLAQNPDDAPVTEDEAPLVEAVNDAMADILTKMDEHETRAMSLAEEADLVFNPFPGRVVIHVPGEIIASEGFTSKSKELTIEPVDTVGAGDTFCGYLAAGLDQGLKFEVALRRAAVAGSLACLKPGAQPSIPLQAEVDRHLAAQ